MMSDLKCEWQIEAELGEGPLWVARENALYWVDIVWRNVHRLSVVDGAETTWTFDTQVTSLAERERGGFAATVREGFAFIDFDSCSIEAIVLPEADMPGNRFNDGKVDKYGRYWGGSMDDKGEVESGSLYRLDADLSLQKMDDHYIIDNGPAFNVDNSVVYHTDSAKRVVYAFDQDEKGNLSNKREFVRLEDETEGAPDGMTVDSENCIWLCHYGGARITRYSPQGEVLRIVPMPVPNITSCTFGGPELDTLYITTARAGIPAEEAPKYPLAGSLFSVKPGVRGLPTPLFAG
ncbi:MAG: SMP-30/gluconolactonase/LRE family protein [Candidatus Promineifilaceae bacterium]